MVTSTAHSARFLRAPLLYLDMPRAFHLPSCAFLVPVIPWWMESTMVMGLSSTVGRPKTVTLALEELMSGAGNRWATDLLTRAAKHDGGRLVTFAAGPFWRASFLVAVLACCLARR